MPIRVISCFSLYVPRIWNVANLPSTVNLQVSHEVDLRVMCLSDLAVGASEFPDGGSARKKDVTLEVDDLKDAFIFIISNSF
jgi:hypothetical protein